MKGVGAGLGDRPGAADVAAAARLGRDRAPLVARQRAGEHRPALLLPVRLGRVGRREPEGDDGGMHRRDQRHRRIGGGEGAVDPAQRAERRRPTRPQAAGVHGHGHRSSRRRAGGRSRRAPGGAAPAARFDPPAMRPPHRRPTPPRPPDRRPSRQPRGPRGTDRSQEGRGGFGGRSADLHRGLHVDPAVTVVVGLDVDDQRATPAAQVVPPMARMELKASVRPRWPPGRRAHHRRTHVLARRARSPAGPNAQEGRRRASGPGRLHRPLVRGSTGPARILPRRPGAMGSASPATHPGSASFRRCEPRRRPLRRTSPPGR